MSASLVGSEMCIRDSSASSSPSRSAAALALDRVHVGECLPPESFRCRCPCLLYTSDAADDM
eukprot:11004876-Alexandrium_andersonii.AAC.1